MRWIERRNQQIKKESKMKQFIKNPGPVFANLPDALRNRRWVVWTLFLSITVFCFMGISRNNFDMTLDSWFSDTDPVKLALNSFKDQFGSDDTVYLIYHPKDGDLFSKKSLTAVEGIRDELLHSQGKTSSKERTMNSHITRVDTLASAKILTTEDGALVARRFLSGKFPETEAQKAALQKEALAQKTFPLYYFSKDFQYGAIVIQTDLGTDLQVGDNNDTNAFADDNFDDVTELAFDTVISEDVPKDIIFKPVEMEAYSGLMNDIHAIIEQPKYADLLEYHPVGNPSLMAYFTKQVEESGPLFIGMLVVIVLFLLGLFRSFSAVLWPVLIVITTCIWTLGVSGWLGGTISTMVSLTIMLILAIGIADTVHIISGYLLFKKEKMVHAEALRSTYGKVVTPCFLTTLTTMIGMFSLTLSPIGHIKTFGLMSAMGVGFAFVISIFVLPLMLDLWAPVPENTGPSTKRTARRWFSLDTIVTLRKLFEHSLSMAQSFPKTIISIFAIIFICCAVGATLVKVDSNMVKSFKKGSALRSHYQIVDQKMAGTNNMEIYIDAGTEDALLDPRVMERIDQLQRTIEKKYFHLVVRTFSLADITKDAYQVLNDGDKSFYKVPASKKLLTQTLFMFNNANPEDRRRIVSDNYQKTHISVQLYNAGSYRYTALLNDVGQDIDAAFSDIREDFPGFEAEITGSLALVMKLADYIGWSQIKSLATVIGIISLIMIFLYGSITLGMISIIPNMIPVTLVFGLMGVLGIALDSDTIIIAPVIIGIAVDDTIHFLAHYRDEVRKDGDLTRAMRNTIHEVGQAISFTSLILGFGFLTLAFSTNTSFIKVGIFGSLAIFTALLCDLLLLPALLSLFKPRLGSKTRLNRTVSVQLLLFHNTTHQGDNR